MRDYSELEGKEIIYAHDDGTNEAAIVVGCDPYIGITIVSKENKGKYLVCYRGPKAPQWRNMTNPPKFPENPEDEEIFQKVIKAIDEGVYTVYRSIGFWTNPFITLSANTCAFAQ